MGIIFLFVTIGIAGAKRQIFQNKDVNVVGSNVTTLVGDINIEGDNVNIASAVGQGDSHYRYEYEKTGLTIGLGGTFIDPLKSAYDYSQVSKNAQTDELKYTAGAKAVWEVNNAVGKIGEANQNLAKYNSAVNINNTQVKWNQTANDVGVTDKPFPNAGSTDQDLKTTKSSGDMVKENININISLGTQKTSAKQDTVTQTVSGSNLSAGGDVKIVARGKDNGNGEKEGGDINVVGSNISGENVTLKANEDVNILAGQNTTDMTGSNKSSSASIGVSVNLNQGVSFNASASGGKGNSNGQTVENIESTVTARDTLKIESGKDTNIIGSQVAGNTVVAEIGGDLNIESLQDKDTYHEKNTNWNAGGSISAGGVPSFSGGASTQNIDSTYKSVQEQAGIYAGTGGFDITVGGNTDLKGAVIDSKADADKNKLSTDTITYSDIKNEAEWSAETKGVNYQKGDGVANKDKGLTPNFSGSKGEDDSTTQSAIAPGEIEIRSDEGKDEKDKTDLADLSRDPDKANNPLDKIFDKDKILEKQQAAALFGEIGFTLAGDLAAKMGWKEGSAEKVLLHGLIAGLMAEINGGKFGDGLTVGAINELLVGQLANLKDGKGKPLISAAMMQWISTSIGGAINGNQGAGVAGSATKNNFAAHIKDNWEKLSADELEWMTKEIESCNGDSACITNAQNYYGRINAERLANEWSSNLQTEVRVHQLSDGTFYLSDSRTDEDGTVWVTRNDGSIVTLGEYDTYRNGEIPRLIEEKKQSHEDAIKKAEDEKKEAQKKADEIRNQINEIRNEEGLPASLNGIADGTLEFFTIDLVTSTVDIALYAKNFATDATVRQDLADDLAMIAENPSLLGEAYLNRWNATLEMSDYEKSKEQSKILLEVIVLAKVGQSLLKSGKILSALEK